MLTVLSVKVIMASSIQSNWRGTLQVVETCRGFFLDNSPNNSYQPNPKAILGYNWSLEVGNTLVTNKDYVIIEHNGRPWIKRINA